MGEVAWVNVSIVNSGSIKKPCTGLCKVYKNLLREGGSCDTRPSLLFMPPWARVAVVSVCFVLCAFGTFLH